MEVHKLSSVKIAKINAYSKDKVNIIKNTRDNNVEKNNILKENIHIKLSCDIIKSNVMSPVNGNTPLNIIEGGVVIG